MVQAQDQLSSQVVSDTRQLEGYFSMAATPRDQWLVGVEQEKLAVRSSGAPVPYEGADGVAALLERLRVRGWSPLQEGGHLIGLARPAEQVTLEPGMQVEQSGPALASAAGCRE